MMHLPTPLPTPPPPAATARYLSLSEPRSTALVSLQLPGAQACLEAQVSHTRKGTGGRGPGMELMAYGVGGGFGGTGMPKGTCGSHTIRHRPGGRGPGMGPRGPRA